MTPTENILQAYDCIVHYDSEFFIIPMHLIGSHENPLQKSQSFKTSY